IDRSADAGAAAVIVHDLHRDERARRARIKRAGRAARGLWPNDLPGAVEQVGQGIVLARGVAGRHADRERRAGCGGSVDINGRDRRSEVVDGVLGAARFTVAAAVADLDRDGVGVIVSGGVCWSRAAAISDRARLWTRAIAVVDGAGRIGNDSLHEFRAGADALAFVGWGGRDLDGTDEAGRAVDLHDDVHGRIAHSGKVSWFMQVARSRGYVAWTGLSGAIGADEECSLIPRGWCGDLDDQRRPSRSGALHLHGVQRYLCRLDCFRAAADQGEILPEELALERVQVDRDRRRTSSQRLDTEGDAAHGKCADNAEVLKCEDAEVAVLGCGYPLIRGTSDGDAGYDLIGD